MALMWFSEWIEFEKKRKSKEKKHERPNGDAGQENGVVSHEGKASRDDSKIYTTDVYDFTNTQWQDYSGGGNS